MAATARPAVPNWLITGLLETTRAPARALARALVRALVRAPARALARALVRALVRALARGEISSALRPTHFGVLSLANSRKTRKVLVFCRLNFAT